MATILVVDDLASNRDFLVTLLRYQGHRLVEAVNGQEGLSLIQAERPDLVITDVLMPIMDGYELVRQLRLDPATSGIPVVFYTAHYGEREAKALALSSGVAHVLTKPTEALEVLRVVSQVLSGENAVTSRALTHEFARDHLRLLTDKLSQNVGELQEANARLRALVNIGLELASERDAERLLETVCESARELFGATYVTLGLVERDDRVVRRVVTCGTHANPDWMEIGAPLTGLLSAVVAERRTVRGTNPSGDPRAAQLPPQHPTVQSFLIAPLTSPAHVYGWICLVRNEGAGFAEEDEQLIMALAGQVGRVYENGYFYSIAEKRARDLEEQIAQRQHVESSLRVERDRAQRYLDTAEVVLLSLDTEGRITLINRYGCTLLEWTADELIGCDWFETCVPGRLRVELTAKFHQLLDGDLSVVENPILTKSGNERLIEWRNTILRDDAATIVGTFSSGTDVTERTQAIAAVRAGEERMRFALENADVGIWDMDYNTGDLRWSERLEAQYGLKPGTFAGTFAAFIEHIHPDDVASVLETLGTAMRAGSDFSVLNRTILPNGKVRWLSGAGRVLLDSDGRPVRAVGISMDITERRTLEEQYQQAQKMEAIGRLAGGVAHDFNNLLTAILGYCELLLAEFDEADPHRADIAEIQSAGNRAAGLTRQLLAFSRKQIIEPTLLDLNVIITDIRAMLGRLIGEDVKVILALPATLSVVKADRSQVEQIILNLAVNARDAMPKGGILTIETANVELDEEYAKTHLGAKPGHYVALTVTDTGVGMSPEVQAHLFEPFFTTKEPGKGTGLGLATVHGIMARSGGVLGVYSELGKGTSFKAYFPSVDVSEPVAKAPSVAAPEGRGETVLLVEDAEGIRGLTKRLLERQGYNVLIAANADEAIEQFDRSARVDVLLTDVVMPGTSGPELTQELVKRRPELKVIYMSGYTEEAIVHHGVLDPGIAFIHKPFTSEALAHKIRLVLDR